jgi:putative inorganic carbon (hco3(-)) transporter
MVYKNPLNYPIIALLISTAISTGFSINQKISVFGVFKRYDGLLPFICFIFLFYVVVQVVKKKDISLFIFALTITAIAACIYGLCQSYRLDAFFWTTDFGYNVRPSSTYGHPAFLSLFLIMVLPLTYYGILCGQKWLYPVAGLIMYVMFLTKTRAAFVGMMASTIYFFILYRKQMSWKLVGLILTAVIAINIFMPYSPVKRFIHEAWHSRPQGTVFSRIQMAHVGIEIIKIRPWFGIGPDMLGHVYKGCYEWKYNEPCPKNQNRIHNEFFDIAVDTGLVGLSAWLWFVVVYFRMAWRGRHSLLTIALSSSIVACMVNNMFSFTHVPVYIVFWFIVGMTVISVRESDESIQGNKEIN